ncbi:uncharacterized protein ACNS7B_003992 [Menidia menidia]
MVVNIVRKPLGFILIVSAHVIFNGHCQDWVRGISGKNISLQFTFNVSVTNESKFAVYITGEKKITEYPTFRSCFDIYPQNSSVFYHISNLTLNNSELYWASLFDKSKPAEMSNKVYLTVQEDPKNPTDSSLPFTPKTGTASGSSEFISNNTLAVLVVTPVMLLAVGLPFLLCCLIKTKDKQHEGPQRNSNPTVQESIEGSINAPGPSLIYSVLDFPKSPQAVVEFHPSDTEYASISYAPEKRL